MAVLRVIVRLCYQDKVCVSLCAREGSSGVAFSPNITVFYGTVLVVISPPRRKRQRKKGDGQNRVYPGVS